MLLNAIDIVCMECGKELELNTSFTVSLVDVDNGDPEVGPVPPQLYIFCQECEKMFESMYPEPAPLSPEEEAYYASCLAEEEAIREQEEGIVECETAFEEDSTFRRRLSPMDVRMGQR